MSDGDSCRLVYYQGEPELFDKIRELWDEIFDDPEAFAEYYFREVCLQNRILLAFVGDALAGMVHLNPYDISVYGKKKRCYYVVGVSVRPEFRGRGVMRQMMKRAIADMKAEGCLFTFLMPEREEYYESLGFEKVYHTLELDIDITELEEEDTVPDDLSGEEGYYMKHIDEVQKEDAHYLSVLAAEINEVLSKRYQIYAHRTASYLESMCMEHTCQNGGVIAVYEDGMRMEDGQAEERLAGLFAYDVYDDTMYVERFESFDEHVRYVLDAVLRLAERAFCRRLVLTMSEKHFCDDIANMLGIAARMNEGRGIMALPLGEDREKWFSNLRGHCFFDEIV